MTQSTLTSSKRWRTVTPPAGWTWTPSFVIKQKGRKFKVTGWTIDAARPTGKAYYVATDGSDANSGLDAAHPLRSVRTACLKADVVVVYVKAGLYGKTYSYIASSRSISLIATGGRVTASAHFDSLTWSADETAYTAALVSAQTYMVVDATQVDAKGDFAMLTKVADAATVKTTPGSWYASGTDVWVRTSDNREPDTSIRVYDKSFFPCALGLTPTGGTFYVENFDFEGGYHALFANAQTKTGNSIYLNHCTFKYANNNGFSNEGHTAYLLNCESARNNLDAFSEHISGAVVPKMALINCLGRDSITSGSANNASTSHEAADLVNIQSEFYNTAGPVVHTVNNDSKTWCLGCKAHDSRASSAPSKVGFMIGALATGDTAVMWLDCCEGYNNTGGDLRANTGNTLNYRKFRGSLVNAGAGTAQAY